MVLITSTRRFSKQSGNFQLSRLSCRSVRTWSWAALNRSRRTQSSYVERRRLSLLKRAALCITHAGLNTSLESLAQGVPMVAIPVTNDQPGVAARIAYTKTGEFVEV